VRIRLPPWVTSAPERERWSSAEAASSRNALAYLEEHGYTSIDVIGTPNAPRALHAYPDLLMSRRVDEGSDRPALEAVESLAEQLRVRLEESKEEE
jgi:hypothetical protein